MKRIGMLIFTVMLAFSAFSATKFVLPKKGNVGVYANQIRKVNEQAIEKVGVNDRLKVLNKKGKYYQVKTPSGNVGWVESYLVAETSGKSMMFDDAEVTGYLDNPTPVYIIDADSKDNTPISLDRSFADAIKQNVDRETIERAVTK